jgi:hypothetical protein
MKPISQKQKTWAVFFHSTAIFPPPSHLHNTAEGRKRSPPSEDNVNTPPKKKEAKKEKEKKPKDLVPEMCT